MTGWIITALAGLVLGGGGIAALVMTGGGGIAALLAIRALPTPAAIWRFLTNPVGVLITMAVLTACGWIAGDLRGKRVARAECDFRIAASIEAAKRKDEQVAADAKRAADLQRGEAAAREAAIQEEVRRYVDDVGRRVSDDCKAGGDADRYNDGLGLQPDDVQRPVPIPPARPGRGAIPGALPQGKGGR